MAKQTHRVSLEAQSLQSPREPLPPLPTAATQVARGLDSLRNLLPVGQFVAIVCSDFSRLAVVVVADVMAAMEHTFFALSAARIN